MLGEHLILGSASRDHLLYTIADAHDHIPKSFDIYASCHFRAPGRPRHGTAAAITASFD
jgi:hypothetical protein